MSEAQPPVPETSGGQPDLPFFRQTFDGSQPEIEEHEAAYVESAFVRLIDGFMDTEHLEGDVDVEALDDEGMTSTECSITASDGRPCEVAIGKDSAGGVLYRTVSIPWAQDRIGMTRYSVHYTESNPRVTREDDTGTVSQDLTFTEAHRAALEGASMDREHGLNDQPIGRTEMEGLRDYLLPEPSQ